jgi:hypothetical protein
MPHETPRRLARLAAASLLALSTCEGRAETCTVVMDQDHTIQGELR